jgi:hypothetical protein
MWTAQPMSYFSGTTPLSAQRLKCWRVCEGSPYRSRRSDLPHGAQDAKAHEQQNATVELLRQMGPCVVRFSDAESGGLFALWQKEKGAAMTPYYQDASVTLYHADYLEVLPTLEPCDVLLTDPPYGVLADTGSAATRRSGGNKDDGRIAWDVAPTAEELPIILAAARIQMIWGGCHLSLPKTLGYLVWDKMIDGLNFGEVEFCWTNQTFAPRVFRYRAVGVDGGKQHPTQKPEALMRWCLNKCPGKIRSVIDPFAGSGTTLVAAKLRGATAIGIEREEQYCELAATRLRTTHEQGDLFGGAGMTPRSHQSASASEGLDLDLAAGVVSENTERGTA